MKNSPSNCSSSWGSRSPPPRRRTRTPVPTPSTVPAARSATRRPARTRVHACAVESNGRRGLKDPGDLLFQTPSPMKIFLCLLLLTLGTLSGHAFDFPARIPRPAGQPTAAEVTLTGVLQRRVAIGGETTGWVLRYDKYRTIELTFTFGALAPVPEGAWGTRIGTHRHRHYS